MTTFWDITKKCFICQKESSIEVLGSSNTFGGTPDLDTRPPEMMRSTMGWWIHECPHCGYVASSLDNETSITPEFLKSERYTTCAGQNFQYPLAAKFYKDYLIRLEDRDPSGAFNAALNAAWACDDFDTEENACHCRLLALEQLDQLLEKNSSGADDLVVTRADLLRRTGQFDRLIAEYTSKHFDEELLNKVIAFQLKKAADKDTGCYQLEDIPGVEY